MILLTHTSCLQHRWHHQYSQEEWLALICYYVHYLVNDMTHLSLLLCFSLTFCNLLLYIIFAEIWRTDGFFTDKNSSLSLISIAHSLFFSYVQSSVQETGGTRTTVHLFFFFLHCSFFLLRALSPSLSYRLIHQSFHQSIYIKREIHILFFSPLHLLLNEAWIHFQYN